MCGFVGVFTRAGNTLPLTSTEMLVALKRLKHRGPDAQSMIALTSDDTIIQQSVAQWELSPLSKNNARAYIAQARLKIIDRSDMANQPFYYQAPSGKKYWVAYNGEIYNYRQLRQQLKEKGYRFQTDCDVEVIPALYDLFGPDAVKELNGMFAFVILDVEEKQLYLARDRYGIKPLYITRLSGGHFAFASELKALMALPGISDTFNIQALYEHLTFQFSFQQQTLLKDVHHFPQGHWAIWDSKTDLLQTQCYWQPVFQIETNYSEVDWYDRLRQTMKHSVKSQLISDVLVGSFLSGGLDTSIITALAVKENSRLSTITCGFDISGLVGQETQFDERQAASRLATDLGTLHQECVVSAETLPTILDTVVWHLDDFQAGISYQNFVSAALARQSMTVILSGVGGDELFAGYPWRHRIAADKSLTADNFNTAYYQQWVRLLSDAEKQKLFSSEALKHVYQSNTSQLFQSVFRSSTETANAQTFLQQALAFDSRYFLHALLAVEDRLSMASGLESRVPFLDNHMIDLALSMPDAMKLHFSNQQEWVGKWALRQAFKNNLPSWVLNGRKQGFTPPDASWYRGSLSIWVEQRLFSDEFLSRGLFQPSALRHIWQEHQSGQRNHRFLIWSLLCLESWQRQFLDKN